MCVVWTCDGCVLCGPVTGVLCGPVTGVCCVDL